MNDKTESVMKRAEKHSGRGNKFDNVMEQKDLSDEEKRARSCKDL